MNRSHVNFIRKKIKKTKLTLTKSKKESPRYVPAGTLKTNSFSIKRVAYTVGIGLSVGVVGLLANTINQTNMNIESIAMVNPVNVSTKADIVTEVSPSLSPKLVNAPVVEVIQEKNDIMTWEEATMLNDLQSKNIQGVQSVKKGENGNVSLVINTDQFFMVGTAKIASEKVPQLSEIAGALKATAKELGDRVALEIEGHTDDSPIVKQKHLYQSNWELSAARAASLVHLFEEAGFDKEKMKLVGYGDSRPMVPNRDPNGEPIVGNAVKNRRIVLRVYPAEEQKSAL